MGKAEGSPAKVRVLLDDPRGDVRDPQVDYDGRTILFSYRRGGTEHYHLYEIRLDGSGLRQIDRRAVRRHRARPGCPTATSCSSPPAASGASTATRRRWPCSIAATRRPATCAMLSSNNEHDNTPWLLPSGQILYTRWEYVDRNQMAFHHLWTTSPDGTRQTVFYGNSMPGTTMIDAKPIPGSRKIVASFSPGHGHPRARRRV